MSDAAYNLATLVDLGFALDDLAGLTDEEREDVLTELGFDLL